MLALALLSGCAAASEEPMFDRYYLGEAPYGEDVHANNTDEEGNEYPGIIPSDPLILAAGFDLVDLGEAPFVNVDLDQMEMVDDSTIPEEEVISEEGDVSEEFAEDNMAEAETVTITEEEFLHNSNPPDQTLPPIRDATKAAFAKGEIDRFKFDGSVNGFACDTRFPKRSVEAILTLRNSKNELLERIRVTASRKSGDTAKKECLGGTAHTFSGKFTQKIYCGHKVGLIIAGADNATEYFFIERRKNKCSPIGETFHIRDSGEITGWACDQNGPTQRTVVSVETSKGLKKNQRTNVASGIWINSRCSGGSEHRFKIDLGRQMACGETVHVYSNNIEGSPGTERVLIGKRKRPACPPPPPPPPKTSTISYSPGASGHIHPVPGSPITSPYGYRWHPIKKAYKLHTGTDFGASSGTRIRATQAGTVTIAGWNGNYGRMVAISHGNGVVTRYGHMSSIAVRKGQKISRGTTIGRVGTTGLSTGPHLHFEYMRSGSFKNPMSLIR